MIKPEQARPSTAEQMAVFIAGVSRAGTTLLTNLMTRPPNRWILMEPGITRQDMGEHVRLQAERFGLSISPEAWRSDPPQTSALETFRRVLLPRLSAVRWGVKEVNPTGWGELIEVFRPRAVLLCVRNIRDCAVSLFEKHQRSHLPGQDEAWMINRLLTASQAVLSLKKTLSPGCLRVVRYEDFVTHPDARIQLSEWLNWPLDGDPAWCMDLYGRQNEPVRHAGQIGSGSVNRSQSARSPDSLEFAEKVVACTSCYQEEFGYTPHTSGGTRSGSRSQPATTDAPRLSSPVLDSKELRVEVPPVGEELDRFIGSLGPYDRVLIPDSEDARFDPLKLRLFELEHVGRDPHTHKQVWRGTKEQRESCPAMPAGQTLPTIICFYTTDTRYAELAKRLQAGCQQLRLPHAIEGISSQCSWEFNCAFKSRFILAKWCELKRPILWVDADAIVRRVPTLLARVDADFAINKVDRWQFNSSTLFFNHTENALHLLESWVRHCEAMPAVWDQEHLDTAWEETADRFPLKTLWLPQSYARIFDRAALPGEDPSPVIEQFQASRTLKKTISNRPPTPVTEYPRDFIAARAVSRPFRNQPRSTASSSPQTQMDSELVNFVKLLASFFATEKVLQVDWESAEHGRRFIFTAEEQHGSEEQFEGPTPRLSSRDDEFETVFNLGSLAAVGEPSLAGWLAELRRVTGKNLWLALHASPGRDRTWWERQLLEAGFRKHPLSQSIVPFEAIETEGSTITLQFEKVPQPALDRYPLEVLKAERDLHMDMLREPGIRSDAHLARYTLAREYLKPGMVVLDAACGLGYGSAMMATRTGVSQIIGVDCCEWAVDYARANYAAVLPQLEFHAGDATRLRFLADACIDAVVSFETLEHLPNPDLLLREFARVLKPGGLFIGSVPNLWIDEKGHNPVPYHLHIYDHDQFQQQVAKYFGWQALYRQNAGGGWKRPQPRTLHLIENQRPATADLQDAEWWIGVAGKPHEQRPINHRQTDKGGRRQPEPGANQKQRVACIGDVCHASSP